LSGFENSSFSANSSHIAQKTEMSRADQVAGEAPGDALKALQEATEGRGDGWRGF